METITLYRYTKYCTDEELEDFNGKSNVDIRLESFDIVRKTPKGYWIKISHKKEKWCSASGKKRFAYSDKKEALENFIRRTKRSILINMQFIRFSELALIQAKKIEEELKND
jgi:CO dehydrogenase/acetyl-CoA synthase epsilon subunit